jgi:hypothetical protein
VDGVVVETLIAHTAGETRRAGRGMAPVGVCVYVRLCDDGRLAHTTNATVGSASTRRR